MNLRFRTRDDLLYTLMDTHESVGINRGANELNLDIVEKTYNSGGVFIGERRISTKEINIFVELNYSTDTAYRNAYNDISYYAANCEYIEDTDNSLRTKVELVSIQESLDTPENMLRAGRIQLIFNQLTPYWEDLTAQTDTDTGTDLTFSINNSGVIDCSPTFTITASALCTSFKIYITDPVRGIEIQDIIFGSNATLDSYVIDCNNGTALLGDDGYNRADRIKRGSGYFDFPVGSFTLSAEFSVSCQCDISWRRRYYV